MMVIHVTRSVQTKIKFSMVIFMDANSSYLFMEFMTIFEALLIGVV